MWRRWTHRHSAEAKRKTESFNKTYMDNFDCVLPPKQSRCFLLLNE